MVSATEKGILIEDDDTCDHHRKNWKDAMLKQFFRNDEKERNTMIITVLEALKLIILQLTIIYAILATCRAARRKDIAATIVWCTLWITCVIELR